MEEIVKVEGESRVGVSKPFGFAARGWLCQLSQSCENRSGEKWSLRGVCGGS
jgi:hypothetical protein